MKLGILTHYNVSSHGALLQMYALQCELKQLGHDVYILEYSPNYDFIDDETRKRFSANIKNVPYYLNSYLLTNGLNAILYQYKKQKILKSFREKYFKLIPYTKSSELDCVIVGSDEVFALENGIDMVMFGHAVTSKKIISYAPSFGQTDLNRINTLGCYELIKSGLQKFSTLSARDNGTKMVLDTLLNTNTPIVCDPALLHDFQKSEIKKRQNYIVVYSYQSNFKEADRISAIQNFAKKNDCKLYSVGSYYKWCNKQINCDPLDMIDIFANARYIITDTFHGTITSYIAHTPMAVFIRNNNNVKLENLINSMGISDRKVTDLSQLDAILNTPVSFSKLDKTVCRLRNEGFAYLSEALSV